MGQEEVLKFLESNPNKWFSSSDIAKNLKVNAGNVSRCLNILVNEGYVKIKRYQNKDKQWRVRYKLEEKKECPNCKALASSDPENWDSFCGFCGESLYIEE